MYRSESLPYIVAEREATYGKDFTNRDGNITRQEQLHFSATDSCSFPFRSQQQKCCHEDRDAAYQYRAKIGEISAVTEVNAAKDASSVFDSWWLVVLEEELAQISMDQSQQHFETHVAHRKGTIPAEILHTVC